jgi:ubiquinone/menaquinone biosynthesis C-methylase UbiE
LPIRGAFYHDEEERRRWQNPEAILADIGLKPGSTFVDLGCGEGFFTLPAARLVGKGGRVHGVDANSAAMDRLREKAAAEGLSNMELKAAQAEETVLCEACADIVFLGIVLHDFSEPAKVLANARKMLKPTGRLVNLDWKREPMGLGPPFKKRFSEDKAVRLILAAGFKVEAVGEAKPYHYLIIAKPQPAEAGK